MEVEAPALPFSIMLLIGSVIMIASVATLIRHEIRSVPPKKEKGFTQSTRCSRSALIAIFLLLIIGFIVRFEGIEQRGMSHVEVYVPNIELPKDISEPPPRTDLVTTLWWHFHDEPHPQGYFLFMFLWTKVFGTSLTAIRLPSLLFGIGAILLTFFLVRRLSGEGAAILAAALITFNGHQVYWSINARMFSMACFLSLLSSLLLIRLLDEKRPRPLLEGIYSATCLIGISTHIFFWPFFAGHILLTLFRGGSESHKAYRLLGWQCLIVILGTPFWTHALYRSRDAGYLEMPNLVFAREFFSFGFLFERDFFSDPVRNPPVIMYCLTTFFSLAAMISAIWKSKFEKKEQGSPKAELPKRYIVWAAVGTAIFILGLAGAAHRRQFYLALTALLPLASILIIPIIKRTSRILDYIVRVIQKSGLGEKPVFNLIVLTLVPFVLLFAVSLKFPLLNSRGFLLVIPYLSAWIAVGIIRSVRGRIAWVSLVLILAVLHAGSIHYFRAVPSPAEYRVLAEELKKNLEREDLIFILPHWTHTPLFYHLKGEWRRLVGNNWKKALQNNAGSRIWIVNYAGMKLNPNQVKALAKYDLVKELKAYQCCALLYIPTRKSNN